MKYSKSRIKFNTTFILFNFFVKHFMLLNTLHFFIFIIVFRISLKIFQFL